MSDLYLHTTPILYETLPFWTILQQASRLDWKNTLVIVSSPILKNRLYSALENTESEHPLPAILTIDEVIFRTFDSHPNTTPALEDAILKQAIAKLSSQTPLNPFYETEGFQKHFLSFLNSFAMALADWKKITRDDSALLKTLADTYFDQLSESGLLSRTQILGHAVTSQFSQQSPLFEKKHVYLFGFHTLTNFEKVFFSHTLTQAQTISALVIKPPTIEFHDSFYSFLNQLTVTTKKELAFTSPVSFPIKFQGKKYDSIIKECHSIIDIINQHPHQNIGIFAPNKRYKSLISSKLDEAQITHQTQGVFELKEVPFFSFVSSVFNAIQSGDKRHIYQFFTSPFVTHIVTSKGMQTVNPALLHALLLEESDDDDLFWINACISFLNKLDSRKEEKKVEYDAIQTHQLIFETLLPLIKLLRTCPDFPSYKEAWQTLFDKLNIQNTLISYPHPTYRDKSLMAYTTFFSLMETYFQTVCKRRFKNPSFSKGFYTFLRDAKLSMPENTYERIRFLHSDDAWNSLPEIIILPGLSNSFWPGTFNQYLWPLLSYNAFSEKALITLYLLLSSASTIYTSHSQEESSLLINLSQSHLFKIDWETPITPEIDTQNQPDLTSLAFPPSGFLHPETQASWAGDFEKRPLSASQLELYQTCPYRYFIRYVLDAQAFETLRDDVDAAEWGKLVHTILQEIETRPLENSVEIAKTIFEKQAKDTLYWELKRDLLFGTETKPGLLHKWMELRKKYANNLIVLALEKEFFLPGHPPIKGVIDAVMHIVGTHWIVVWDYKTGKKTPTSPATLRLESLQLPLYAKASQALFPTFQIGGTVIFHLNDPNTAAYKVSFATPDIDKSLFPETRSLKRCDTSFINELDTRLSLLSSLMSAGLFTETPLPELSYMPTKKDVCVTCDYTLVCRYKGRFEGGFL